MRRSGLSQSAEKPPANRKRRAGGWPAGDRIPEETGRHGDSRWDIPRKRALFTSDRPDSTTSGSAIPEGHADRPPEVKYSERLTSARRQDEGGTEGLCSPHMELEMAVIQLQRDVEDCRSELELARKKISAVTRQPPRRSGFTSTPVPKYSGKSNWEQYLGTVPRGVRSHCMFEWLGRCHGGPTAAIPSGDALNVALLVPESRRVAPGFLIKSLSEHYNAPGRLAEYKRQFQRAFRRPGDDPSIFATELETLARRAFMDIDRKIQLQMVRDRFIDGHALLERPMTTFVDSFSHGQGRTGALCVDLSNWQILNKYLP